MVQVSWRMTLKLVLEQVQTLVLRLVEGDGGKSGWLMAWVVVGGVV